MRMLVAVVRGVLINLVSSSVSIIIHSTHPLGRRNAFPEWAYAIHAGRTKKEMGFVGGRSAHRPPPCPLPICANVA